MKHPMTARWVVLLACAFLLMASLQAFAQQSDAQVLVAQAILAYDDHEYDRALDLLNEALTLDPRNVRGLYYRGLVYLAQKKPELAAGSLEQALALDPEDLFIRYELGLAYFTLGEYDKAEPLLAAVFAAKPELDGLGYYVGFLRYRRNDHSGAVQAFNLSQTTDPNIKQLTAFYKGLALGYLGLPERAIVELEEARRLQPGSALSGPIDRMRDTIATARNQQQRLRAEIRIGGFYDDNVPVNPNPSNDPAAEALRTRFSRSAGMLIAPRIDYSWLRMGSFEATAGYSFFQTLNFNVSDFNIQDHLGSLGGFYRGALGSMPYQVGLQYSFDYLFLSKAGFLTRHTPTLSGTLVENGSNLSTILFRYQAKDFLQDAATTVLFPEENRDADNWLVGVLHVFRFAQDKHHLRIGYQFDREIATGSNYSYSGHRIQAGFQYTLPWASTRVRYDYEVHLRYYNHINTLFPTTAPNTVRRRDTEQVHYLRLEKPLPNNFIVSVEYQGILGGSNLPIFDYDRNVYSIILTWVY